MAPQTARYIVGVDLGTTNSALAYVDLQAEGDLAAAIHDFPVPQLVAAGETAPRRLLASSAYLPAEHELPAGARRLPWGEPGTAGLSPAEDVGVAGVSPAQSARVVPIVGEYAKTQGARVPGRLVSSAKSWLSHTGVDRTAPILPWGAPEGVPRLSPVQASALYLAHLRAAWDHAFPDAPLARQEVVLTVPASFDEVARELTVRAAREAGLGKLTLVEEPQAAFYDWTARHRGQLDKALGKHRLILVVDVGGGTSDFTLIHAQVREGAPPALQRIAVGEHILLGGDNMDVTLARTLEARLGPRLDAAQWSTLVQACRLAKEALLTPGGPAKTSVAVPGRGSKLVGGAVSAELSRAEVLSVVLDGFFPRTLASELPARGGRTGLQELGLPYASDPAVTRHIAAFLRGHLAEVQEALGTAAEAMPRPDALLLNGGVFAPEPIGARLVEAVSGWFPGCEPVGLLSNEALDLAVARGAAYYGLARRGLALRIGGGSARAYFVGIQAEQGPQALCVIPRHLEEEREVEVPRSFALVLDRPARFPLYATSLHRGEKPGDVTPVDEEVLNALPPIQTVLRAEGAAPAPGGRAAAAGQEVAVRLRASLTEIGTLALWCVAQDRDARWKLEFQLRGAAEDAGPTAVAPMPKRFGEAKDLVELVYGRKPVAVEKKDVKNLLRNLEKVLGPREAWSTPVCRELWAALHAGFAKRRRSVDHERLWCNLTGYCLRPGFGAPLDAWRAGETWKAFEQGLQFRNEPHNWEAWWVLWRRIAGGLDGAAQRRLFDTVAPLLRPATGRSPPKPKGVKAESSVEVIRMVASLERLEAERKVEIGGWIVDRIGREGAAPHLLWALGRLGARVPFYGSGHACVPAPVAEGWIETLLALPPGREDAVGFALAQLARQSGDRHRDIAPALREQVERKLAEGQAPEPLQRMVREQVELEGGEQQQVFGESLPAGLRLLRD